MQVDEHSDTVSPTGSAALRQLDSVEECVDQTLAAVGSHLVIAAPLGLGKPNQLLNAFYQRAKSNPDIKLEILTALSLEKPTAGNQLEANFLTPFVERQFGNYEALAYVQAQRSGTLPDNIRVSEFYFKAGSMKNVSDAQRNYICTNYTFAARDLLARGVNVLVQMVSEKVIDGKPMLSLSCNTDVTLDLLPGLTDKHQMLAIAQVHSELPFMYNKAMVDPAAFDMIVRNPAYNTTLFATPNTSVSAADAVLGFHASMLIKDGGTLQIGIGSLGDAITYACMLRHQDNEAYREFARQSETDMDLIEELGGLDTFERGLYGCSEMFVNGFLHLLRAGILKREVYDNDVLQSLVNKGELSGQIDEHTLRALLQANLISATLSEQDVEFLKTWGVFSAELMYSEQELSLGKYSFTNDLNDAGNYRLLCEHALGDRLKNGVVMHGGFFLGPADFYDALRRMTRIESEKIAMDSVRQINRIDNVALHSAQRQHARFINTGMMVTLGGAVVSDGLENGQVISGVGGQYNFVAQAHELEGARSVICVRSTRGTGKNIKSNIVPSYGHVTIPRHLRDIVITEYGIADLRARTDEEIIKALLNISDSRFQYELLGHAIACGKIDSDYSIPLKYCNNTPDKISERVSVFRRKGLFPPFPLGSDFTDEEIALGSSLRDMKAMLDEPKAMIKALIRSFTHNIDEHEAQHYLERIGLEHPDTPKEVILQHLLLLELEEHGYLRPI